MWIFDVIDVIFSEKLLIGESIGFSWVFVFIIRRKWVWLCVEIGGVILVKVLILLGFYDIGCDIGILGVDIWKELILLGLMGFWLSGLIFKLVCGWTSLCAAGKVSLT